MTKEKNDVVNPAVKFGHGIHRAKKTSKEERKDLKHEKKWVENKMDNK